MSTPALRILARRLGNPIGRPASWRELLELVRRYRSLSPAARDVVWRLVAKDRSGDALMSDAAFLELLASYRFRSRRGATFR